jgi:hypothetical protein
VIPSCAKPTKRANKRSFHSDETNMAIPEATLAAVVAGEGGLQARIIEHEIGEFVAKLVQDEEWRNGNIDSSDVFM